MSEWAAACGRCGADTTAAPLLPEPAPPAPRRPRRPIFFAAVVVAAVVAAMLAVGGHRAMRQTAADLVPPTRRSGTAEVLDFSLLDGRRVQLRYPAGAGIAQLGLTLTAVVQWPGAPHDPSCCAFRVSASRATLAQAYGNARPLERYPATATALYSAGARRLPPGFTGSANLVLRAGHWLLEANTSAAGTDGGPPPMTPAQRRLVAADLAAGTGAAGYPVLRLRPPLRLASAGVLDRMTATFGLGSPYEAQRNVLDVTDGECGRPDSDTVTHVRLQSDAGPPGVTWCDPASGLHVTAIGTAQFVDAVAGGLRLTAAPAR